MSLVTLLALASKYSKDIMYTAIILALCGFLAWVFYKGYDHCEAQVKIQNIDHYIEVHKDTDAIKEKQDAVQRPDTVQLTNSLRAGSF